MVKNSGRRISAAARIMPSADRQFVVPCECSAGVPVTAGQAGGRVACPACGRNIDVPRLRDLTPEPAKTVVDRGMPPWNVARGLALAGAAVAIVAAVTAVGVVPLGSRFVTQPASAAAIRAAAQSAPLAEVLAAWRSIVDTGVRRPPTPEEHRLQQVSAMCSRLAGLLWGVAVVGGGVAVAGFVVGRASEPRA